MEDLEVEIKDLKNAYDDILKAMHNIAGTESLVEEYQALESIADTVQDKQRDLEYELEELQEKEYYNANIETWKKEEKDLERQYWKTQF